MTPRKILGRNYLKNLNAAIALIAAWVFVLVSFFLQSQYGLELFSRSGAMMVLITVVAKQLLLKEKNQFRTAQLKAIDKGEKANLEYPFGQRHPSGIFFSVFQQTAAVRGACWQGNPTIW